MARPTTPATKDNHTAAGPLLDLVVLFTSAMFAGGAAFITVVEHPARMELCLRTGRLGLGSRAKAVAAALLEWKHSYDRAAPWQASMAMLTLVGGVAETLLLPTGGGRSRCWLAGCLLTGLNVPLTLLAIMPLNKALQRRAARVIEGDSAAVRDEDEEGEEVEEEETGAGAGADATAPKVCFGPFALQGAPSTTWMLRAWGQVHAVRTFLGTAGFVLLLAGTRQRGGGRTV